MKARPPQSMGSPRPHNCTNAVIIDVNWPILDTYVHPSVWYTPSPTLYFALSTRTPRAHSPISHRWPHNPSRRMTRDKRISATHHSVVQGLEKLSGGWTSTGIRLEQLPDHEGALEVTSLKPLWKLEGVPISGHERSNGELQP